MQQNPLDREKSEANIPNLSSAAPIGGPYTNEEWKLLMDTPVRIGRAMMAVSPSGAIGTSQEIMALRKSTKDALQGATNPTLKTLYQQLQGQEAMQVLWEDAGHAFQDRWDAANVRKTAISSCQQVVGLLRKAPQQDAQAYKDFVYATARKVAEAAKEGGFMGIGGVAISAEEKSLLDDISKALEIQHA